MDNERIAAAIVAMYKNLDGIDWDDTAEMIQRHAFEMWATMTWSAEAMALYLWQHGWSVDAASDFVDISTSRVWAAIRQYNAERSAGGAA